MYAYEHVDWLDMCPIKQANKLQQHAASHPDPTELRPDGKPDGRTGIILQIHELYVSKYKSLGSVTLISLRYLRVTEDSFSVLFS